MADFQASDRVKATIAAWKTKLLDLTKRNRAINFKVNKVSTVSIVNEIPAEVYRLLVQENKNFSFAPGESRQSRVPDESEQPGLEGEPAMETDVVVDIQVPLYEYDRGTLEDNYLDTTLQTNSSPESLDYSLRRIDEQARSILEEQGVNALFLVLGMLHYYEDKNSDVLIKAPLLLVPVELARRSALHGYKVNVTDEEVIVNPSLVELLKRDYSITLPSLPTGDSHDIADFYSGAAAAIRSQPRWKITNEIYLSLFSFQKLVMYKDLERNVSKIATQELLRQMIDKDGPSYLGLPTELANIELDEYFTPEQCMQVVDADSSQLRAIATVSQNHDLVLEGPPGTGKSQTITNLIAQALSTGKRVLFVAEKMAALDVVYRRLCQVGLGEFCLELHSTKANKKAVMQELKNTLDASLQKLSPTQTAAERLPQVREHLTDYTDAVHTPFGSLDTTPWFAFGEYDSVRSAPRLFLTSDISAVSKRELEDVYRILADLRVVAEDVGPLLEHPWRDSRKTFFTSDDLEVVGELGRKILVQFEGLHQQALSISSLLGVPQLRNFSDLDTAAEVASTIGKSPGAPLLVLGNESWNVPPVEATNLIRDGRKLIELRSRILSQFKETVLEIDPSDEIEYVERKSEGFFSFLAFLDGRYRGIKKRWATQRLTPSQKSMIEQAYDMQDVALYLKERAGFASLHNQGMDLFGSLWNGEQSDWNKLEGYVNWVVDFRKMYISHGLTERAIATASQAAPDLSLIQTVRTLAKELEGNLAKMVELVGWSTEYFKNCDFDHIRHRIGEVTSNVRSGPAWGAFESVRHKLQLSFASEILNWLYSGQASTSDLIPAFKRAFYSRWLSLVFEDRTELRDFHTTTHEQRGKEFRQLDEQVLHENRSKLIYKLRNQVQASLLQSPAKEQMGVLRSQLNRQRGLLPLRTTVQNCLDAIRTIKPCFMMSPQSVAQLLDAEKASFDLIIFDEASQLPTEDAVGSVIRGSKLVVVGDPKQLPPTNFFAVSSGQANVELDEDGLPLFDDSQSILEEMLSSGVPSARLKWHYRSSHESLITFSNTNFYNSDLYTFPSVESDSNDTGLQFHFVPDGVYEGKGLNIVEARTVADAVVDQIKRDPNISLAVGTFNVRQQTAIQDELEIRRRQDPSLEPFFNRGRDDYFFVKNLENIQGDERDVIFISVTYARAHDGVLRYNLGPLNGENGGRRMNVLVSRARKLMKVFSSIRADDINLASTSSKGAQLLRDFLLYAEHKRLDGTNVAVRSSTESPFETEVYDELTSRGLSLIPQVGASGYRIDFGVQDISVPGRFVCGIECDGFSYHSSETARDRDRLRQQVLEGRGWDLHRIWSTDWFKDRNGQIERILALVEGSRSVQAQAALAQGEAITSAERSRQEEADDFVRSITAQGIDEIFGNAQGKGYSRPIAEPYQMARVEVPANLGQLVNASYQQLGKVLMDILIMEAPIHFKELCTRAAAVWGHRVGSSISQKILDVVRAIEQSGHIRLEKDFVLVPSKPITIRSRQGTSMPAEHISPHELAATIKAILSGGHKFDRSALMNEVRSVLGYSRSGQALQAVIGAEIDRLLAMGDIGEGSTGIGLIVAHN